MRVQWRSLMKKLSCVTAPLTCSLLGATVGFAQDFDLADDTEARVHVAQHEQVTVPWDGTQSTAYTNYYNSQGYQAPIYNPHSPEAIFSPQLPGYVGSPYVSHFRPQSLDTPNMIGDFLGFASTATFSTVTAGSLETVTGSIDIPGSGRVPKVAENNSPIPRDRVYFGYNHFHNAFRSSMLIAPNDFELDEDDMPVPIPDELQNKGFHQNRFTIGLEKTLFSGDMSVEFRIPLITQVNHQEPGILDPTQNAASFATDDPLGSFSIVLKKVLIDWYNERSSGVFTGGFGFSFPNAEGATVDLGDASFHVKDTGFHFSPYLAMLIDTQSGFFMQGFAEFDFSTDQMAVRDRTNGSTVGHINIPNSVFLDVGMGYWVIRMPERRWMKGVAGIVEYHYSRQTQDFRSLAFQSIGTLSTSNVLISSPVGRRDLSNLTTGVHVAVSDHVNFRVGGVVPLRNAPQRQFDAEVVFQLDLVR